MAAPNYVPTGPGHEKYYESPPRRRDSWRAERPGDIPDHWPEGPGLGNQGPDQGYALRLVHLYEDRVHLKAGERWEDAAAGCVQVALKRASAFGRAPVVHDLEVAFRIFGFLDEAPANDLVTLRAEAFDQVANPHHYLEARRIADSVSEEVLRQPPSLIERLHGTNWSSLIDVDVLLTSVAGGAHD